MKKLILASSAIQSGAEEREPAGYVYADRHRITSGWKEIVAAMAEGRACLEIEELFTPVSPQYMARVEAMKHEWLPRDRRIYHPIMLQGLEAYEVTRPTLNRYNLVLEHLMRLIGEAQNLTLCDLCCYHGYWSFSLAASGFRVTGVDNDAGALGIARCVGEILESPAEFLEEDAWAFVQNGRRFDVVLLMNALHHLVGGADQEPVLMLLAGLSAITRKALITSFREEDLGDYSNPASWPGWRAVERLGTPEGCYPIWACVK